ncbi:MAG: endonuclease III [Planctomycetaceae bacterium]|jgi:endonuclease-3|nr:endonuclease III [Planctomycetaceae bacterium]
MDTNPIAKQLAKQFLTALKKTFPDAGCSLRFQSPLELLVATILSAQCTDIQVNKVTPKLFAKYRSAKDFAVAPLKDLEEAIRTTGFYHNKAKNIQDACRQIIERFNGNVPDSMDSLTSLPGVGRKTANVVLGNGFGRNDGFVVDTHVFRLAHRMGLAVGTTPEKVEQELMMVFPQNDWAFLSHALILQGRANCKARKPNCEQCPFKQFCPKINTAFV